VHLEPVRWAQDWPVIGEAAAGAMTGEPVRSGPMPDQAVMARAVRPQTSDDFSNATLEPQWEWNHNPDNAHWSLTARSGFLRLIPMRAEDLLTARNTLTQTMQDDAFEFTARLDVGNMKPGVHAGIAMFEKSAGGIEVVQAGSERYLNYFHLSDHALGPVLPGNTLQLRLSVDGERASYFYSLDDGLTFHPLGGASQLRASWWKGPRPSLFAYTTSDTNPGSVDFDWVHYRATGVNPW
jgi:beta-xylosidase